jgi:dTDP-4-dehydrorhamnose reductase
MKKILITGGSGLLGKYLNLAASQKPQIYSIFNSNIGNCAEFNSSKNDIRDKEELRSIFDDFTPEVVIHTAAITNPQLKENQTAKDYYDTNVTASKNIAEFCALSDAKLIYISTDLVYAGYRGSFLKEDGKLIPATLYAETKLMGEVKIRKTTNNHLILRSALLYGFGLNHSRCHFQNVFNDLNNEKPVQLFTDQFR